MIHWLRVVRRSDNPVVLSNCLLHLCTDQPEVGGVIVDAVRLDGYQRIWCDDVEALRPLALCDGEHLGIQAELKDRPGARLARQLGISDFVRPRTKSTWDFDSTHYVRAPVPAAVTYRGLNDHIGTRTHRGKRL